MGGRVLEIHYSKVGWGGVLGKFDHFRVIQRDGQVLENVDSMGWEGSGHC